MAENRVGVHVTILACPNCHENGTEQTHVEVGYDDENGRLIGRCLRCRKTFNIAKLQSLPDGYAKQRGN